MATAEAILAALNLPLLLVAGDRSIRSANPAAEAVFGSGIAGRHYGLVFRQPELVAALEAVLGGSGPQRVAFVQRDGATDRHYEVALRPVEGLVLLAFEDRSTLILSDQMRRDFVANVSHELRTPLTALMGFIETLQGPARDDAPARQRFLSIMSAEASRMVRLVRDLLELSKVEQQERQRPDRTEDISALVREAVTSLRPLAEAAQVAVRIEGDDRPHILPADRDQILQVLANLIENAVKYGSAPGGSVEVTLQTESTPRGEMLRLTVTDHGEGIEAHHIPRLTERFYRVDTHRSREKGGTGLGLAIVKHIVTRHRGRLRIESDKGKGSKFSILLPVA